MTTNKVPMVLDGQEERSAETAEKNNSDGDFEKVSYIQGIDTITNNLYVMVYDT